jgi:hypothetical protein
MKKETNKIDFSGSLLNLGINTEYWIFNNIAFDIGEKNVLELVLS